jgi:hypothetical protein
MYLTLLQVHNILRWLVLILGLIAIIKALGGWQGNKPFTKGDNLVNVLFIAFLHTQLLIGLLLYFVFSPITQQAFADFGAAMKNAGLRFWAVEHLVGMVIAVAVAQIGRIKSKKSTTDLLKHKRAFIFYSIAFIIIMVFIPWGWFNEYRPLFRF